VAKYCRLGHPSNWAFPVQKRSCCRLRQQWCCMTWPHRSARWSNFSWIWFELSCYFYRPRLAPLAWTVSAVPISAFSASRPPQDRNRFLSPLESGRCKSCLVWGTWLHHGIRLVWSPASGYESSPRIARKHSCNLKRYMTCSSMNEKIQNYFMRCDTFSVFF